MDSLQQFIQSNPDPRELKRALAVQMSQRGHGYREIRDVLQVSVGFISTWGDRYRNQGVEGLRLNYWGTAGYLNGAQKQEILNWLEQKDHWLLEEVIEHIEERYGVVYQSPQSYYALLKGGGFSWKKSHASHPDKDPQQVGQKKTKSEGCWSSGGVKLPVDKYE